LPPSHAHRDTLAPLVEQGLELQRLGKHEAALEAFERCLAGAPAHPAAQLHAGMANFHLGRWARGVAHLRVAVAANPGFAAAWSNLAFGLRSLGRSAEARQAIDRSLALDPRLADAWNVLGLIEQDQGHADPAKAHFLRALELNPAFALARMNLANSDQALGRIDAAIEGYGRALALDPGIPEIHYNLGHLHHKATGDIEAAIRHYREAMRLRSDYALARHNLAHALFLVGRFDEAWREYQWRPPRLDYVAFASRTGRPYALPAPGELTGAHLLIVGEQGLGDVLFFLRWARLLCERGARLDFAGDARLHGMLARTGLFDRFAQRREEFPAEGAREVLAGDLPLLIAGSSDSALAPLALAPDLSRVEAAKSRLAALGPGPHVALAWRAGEPRLGLNESLYKEVPLDVLGGALRGRRATWISIQREPRAAETQTLARHLDAAVHDLSAVNQDLEDALALMSVVEDYVGVSNTNVHLRAGTRPTAHILVPFPFEWRWMAQGPSPWFPAMSVYRQDPSGSWREAMERLSARVP
jgi:tetratricopeptide (TPR) repeat protein